MNARQSPLLEIVDLAKTFPVYNAFGSRAGEVTAVDHVSFSIRRGGVYGLAGESGSGKSTIARLIMGLLTPTGGDVLLSGTNITGTLGTRAHSRQVQMVFQNPGSSLNPRRTIGQSIAVPLEAHGHPRADRRRRISELLEMCNCRPISPNAIRTSCPAVRSSASPSHGRSPSRPNWSSSTSQPRPSTSRSRPR